MTGDKKIDLQVLLKKQLKANMKTAAVAVKTKKDRQDEQMYRLYRGVQTAPAATPKKKAKKKKKKKVAAPSSSSEEEPSPLPFLGSSRSSIAPEEEEEDSEPEVVSPHSVMTPLGTHMITFSSWYEVRCIPGIPPIYDDDIS